MDNGQCPGGKMSSIGKYQRNILGLKSTFWAGVSGSFFPLQNIVRAVTEHNLSRWHAFYVNFIFLDSLLYLFKAGGFEDVPMMRKTVDSAPQHLVTIYQSPNSCCQKIGHQDAKKLNIRKPKLIHVRENASADGQIPNTSKHRFIYLTKH